MPYWTYKTVNSGRLYLLCLEHLRGNKSNVHRECCLRKHLPEPWACQLPQCQSTQCDYTLLSSPFLAEQNGHVFSVLGQKIAWGLLHSSHQRTREWDAVSQLITEPESALLVLQSNTLESVHPKQNLPLEVSKAYIDLNFIFIQGKGLFWPLVIEQGLCALIKGFWSWLLR